MPCPNGISVVVPTRDRPDRLVDALRHLVDCIEAGDEIIVVDQSSGEATAQAIRRAGLPVRYLRSGGVGVALARNEGIQISRHAWIATTDDDCRVAHDWLRQLRRVLAGDRRIGIVFGEVRAAELDPERGFTPVYHIAEPRIATRLAERNRVQGLSACMGLTRTAWQALGGFDAMLGAGGPLRSGAESDLALRALANGFRVFETPAICVVHDGFRCWGEGERLLQRYAFGTGAMFAKNLKLQGFPLVALIVDLARRWASGGASPHTAGHGVPRARWRRGGQFAAGFVRGLAWPIDRRSGLFVVRNAA